MISSHLQIEKDQRENCESQLELESTLLTTITNLMRKTKNTTQELRTRLLLKPLENPMPRLDTSLILKNDRF